MVSHKEGLFHPSDVFQRPVLGCQVLWVPEFMQPFSALDALILKYVYNREVTRKMSHFYEANGVFKIISESKGTCYLNSLMEKRNYFIQRRQPKESVQLFAGGDIYDRLKPQNSKKKPYRSFC